MHLLKVNNKEYAVGLWWQTSEANSETKLKKEAVLVAKTFKEEQGPSYNCFASQIKPTGALIGMGNCDSIIEKGQITRNVTPLVLAVINNAESQTFLHKYQFDDGCWVCGVLKGVVHPDGDFFGTAEAAQKVFDSLLEDVFLSVEQIKEFDDVESVSRLEAILKKDIEIFIRPINTRVSKRKIFMILGVTLAAVGIFVIYQSMMERKKADIQKAKMLAAQQLLAEQQASKQKSSISADDFFPETWLSEPTASLFLTSCKKALSDRDLVENGWQIVEWGCAPGEVEIAWKKLDGSSFQVLPKGAEFNIQSPRDCVTTDEYAIENIMRAKTSLWSMEQSSAKIHDIALIFELKIDCDYHLKPESKTIADQNDPAKNRTITASFRKIEFVLTGLEMFPPPAFVSEINSIPGMVMEKLFYKDNYWLLKGTVYVTI
jgi:hypothetical protein